MQWDKRITVCSVLALACSLVIGGWSALAGQESGDKTAQKEAWQRLKTLAGSWQGTGNGTPGTSNIERSYELVLNGNFVHGHNRSVFPPQESNPKGETHEDLSFFSYDAGRGTVVLREFHSEGFVNQYVLSEVSDDGTSLTFTTEQVENGPPGMGARLTLTFEGNDTIAETFYLAMPGEPFKTCVQAVLQRR